MGKLFNSTWFIQLSEPSRMSLELYIVHHHLDIQVLHKEVRPEI